MTTLIQVRNLSKRYRIGQGSRSLRAVLAAKARSKNGRAVGEEHHWAIQDVSFELEPGQALAIIGPNGAGKTTILKLLSRVTKPTSGELHVNGRLSALIELGAGFHPDLSGRDNIFLNGTILGMSRAEIKARFDEIVEFAGIGAFLDTPVKHYSSGMYARLGFAIAAHVDPQILLVDEVLAVGDYAFQMKCYAHMDKLRTRGTSLIFVSHNLEAVRQVCNRGLVLYRGRAIFQGSAAEAVVAYSDALRQAARELPVVVPTEDGLAQRVMTFDAEVEQVSICDADMRPATVLESGASATVVIKVRFNKAVSRPLFAFTIRTLDGQLIYNITTRWMGITTPDFDAGEHCRVEFAIKLALLEGTYELGVDIASSDLTHFFDRLERALAFSVIGSNGAKGVAALGAQVSLHRLPNGRVPTATFEPIV